MCIRDSFKTGGIIWKVEVAVGMCSLLFLGWSGGMLPRKTTALWDWLLGQLRCICTREKKTTVVSMLALIRLNLNGSSNLELLGNTCVESCFVHVRQKHTPHLDWILQSHLLQILFKENYWLTSFLYSLRESELICQHWWDNETVYMNTGHITIEVNWTECITKTIDYSVLTFPVCSRRWRTSWLF